MATIRRLWKRAAAALCTTILDAYRVRPHLDGWGWHR